MRRVSIKFALLSLLLGSVLSGSEPAPAFDNGDCFLCHEEKDAVFENGPRAGQSIYVSPEKYAGSVHAKLGCIECHEKLDPDSYPDESKLPPVNCASCHEDQSASYGVSAHGNGGKIETSHGTVNSPSCSDCHGTHAILSPYNKESSLHFLNLTQTCGECHPGASERFASGSVHHPSAIPGREDFGAWLNHWVKRLYNLLIVVVIGFMLVHNGLAWRRRVVQHLRNPRRTVVRMSRHLRIQHMLLAISFIYLALSGFALAYPDSVLAWAMGNHEGFRRWSHRIVGVFMLLLGTYHAAYLILTQEGRQLFKDFMIRVQDFRDIQRNIGFYLDHRRNKARFGRFGYPEKLEYWAVFWGSLIMGLTGLVIWFKIPVTQHMPRWVIDIATSIHLYEAVLAVLAIIVWHLYHVIFDPGAYPMNGAWLDGKVTPEWMEEEHPQADIEESSYDAERSDAVPKGSEAKD